MTQQAPDPREDPVRAAIDSTTMLVLARFFMPAVVAVLGWFLTNVLADLKSTNERMQSQLLHLNEQQAVAGIATASVTAKLDAAQRQLDRLQIQVDGLPKHN
jgi:hypothetical protein